MNINITLDENKATYKQNREVNKSVFNHSIAYFIVLNSNFERLFKQGKIVAIRIAQVILAIIIAYFITQAIMGLYNATQFTS